MDGCIQAHGRGRINGKAGGGGGAWLKGKVAEEALAN